MGFSELIIILVIVLIIFGAGRLPQIGEGVGKALKGFKKEVNDIPPPIDPSADPLTQDPQATVQADPSVQATPAQDSTQSSSTPTTQPQATASNQPYQPGPELTPGTTAALLYKGAGPEAHQPKQTAVVHPTEAVAPPSTPAPVSMEERAMQNPTMGGAQYPALPASARANPLAKRPSAVVNKKAVARVQAQQAALKAKATPAVAPAPADLQSLGEGLGSAVRTFQQAASDIKNSIDPEMRTIQAELDSAEKEMQQTIEAAKEPPSNA